MYPKVSLYLWRFSRNRNANSDWRLRRRVSIWTSRGSIGGMNVTNPFTEFHNGGNLKTRNVLLHVCYARLSFHQNCSVRLEMRQICFRPGSVSDPAAGESLRRSPILPVSWGGVYSFFHSPLHSTPAASRSRRLRLCQKDCLPILTTDQSQWLRSLTLLPVGGTGALSNTMRLELTQELIMLICYANCKISDLVRYGMWQWQIFIKYVASLWVGRWKSVKWRRTSPMSSCSESGDGRWSKRPGNACAVQQWRLINWPSDTPYISASYRLPYSLPRTQPTRSVQMCLSVGPCLLADGCSSCSNGSGIDVLFIIRPSAGSVGYALRQAPPSQVYTQAINDEQGLRLRRRRRRRSGRPKYGPHS